MNVLSKISWLFSAFILIIGFLFLHYKWVDYGATFFMVFPLAVGFSMGTLDKEKRNLSYLIFSLVVFFGFLLAGALEGLVCVLMALPIFILMIFIGYQTQKYFMKKTPTDSSKILHGFVPLVLLLLINPIEQSLLPEPQIVTIKNSKFLDYDASIVFDEVKSMDKLDAEKPLLMRLGLPAPYKCILEADTIGAKRHCLFNNGEIVAEITKYEKGNLLEMDVISYNLTGRDWFQFVDATYTFEELNGRTKITRTSSYKSALHPRFYWQPLESWGIEQEHKFVLNSLLKNIDEKYAEE